MSGKKISENVILILGIGNILMGDEGVGALVAQFISKNNLPENIICVDGGTGGFHLLEYLHTARKIFLIDATADGKIPGTVTRLQPRFSGDYPKTLTAHDIGLKDMLDSFYLLGSVPDIELFAVSIKIPGEPTLELSPEINQLISILADEILKTAENYLAAIH